MKYVFIGYENSIKNIFTDFSYIFLQFTYPMKMYFIKFHRCFIDTSVTTYENLKGGGHGKFEANFIG